ncbi:transporter substrate-binding domain-containing protein, partial [Candidatus Babeliales bacterium]|nr:transporter substrate-binding domain-containing protein [Candidatus Babeliales bacterium]
MKNLKIFIVLFAIIFMVVGMYFHKSTKNVTDSNILIVGTSLDYPPYDFVDTQTGQPAGFDIDVLAELCKRMQKNLIIKNMPFTSLIFGLLAHDIEMIAAGMSPT